MDLSWHLNVYWCHVCHALFSSLDYSTPCRRKPLGSNLPYVREFSVFPAGHESQGTIGFRRDRRAVVDPDEDHHGNEGRLGGTVRKIVVALRSGKGRRRQSHARLRFTCVRTCLLFHNANVGFQKDRIGVHLVRHSIPLSVKTEARQGSGREWRSDFSYGKSDRICGEWGVWKNVPIRFA